MASRSISRFLLPQGDMFSGVPLRNGRPQISSFLHGQQHVNRHASTSSKPRVLEKPTKFNPPSHSARLNRAPPRQYPGPPLSAPELEAQKTKQYPHMMPPEGSFMRWFLTDRSIHLWITLSTLFSLALFTFISNFRHTSPFADLLPAANTFIPHPIKFISQYIEVYKLHTAHVSAETSERRRKKVEDVQKRSQYRKAHGMDKEQGLGGWMAKDEGESMGPALKVDAAVGNEVGGNISESPQLPDAAVATDGGQKESVYVDFKGRKKPIKKWLGIW